MVRCLRQIFRPTLKWKKKGWGDCTTCQPNEDNKKCAGYVPIRFSEIEIKEKIDE